MGKLLARKKRVKRIVRIGTVSPAAVGQVEDLDARVEAIQLLIPLGLQAVNEELHRAVIELAGPRYQRKGSDQPLRRWGSQPGSVYLSDQKLPVDVPRGFATWAATPRSHWTPTRPCKHLGRWTRVCCCGC